MILCVQTEQEPSICAHHNQRAGTDSHQHNWQRQWEFIMAAAPLMSCSQWGLKPSSSAHVHPTWATAFSKKMSLNLACAGVTTVAYFKVYFGIICADPGTEKDMWTSVNSYRSTVDVSFSAGPSTLFGRIHRSSDLSWSAWWAVGNISDFQSFAGGC